MARLIDADKIMDELRDYADRKCANGYMDTANGILSAVNYIRNNVTRVDAVEVVRCRDCKRCFKHTTKRNRQKMWICMRNELDVCVRPDDFCSYGERKEGADNG